MNRGLLNNSLTRLRSQATRELSKASKTTQYYLKIPSTSRTVPIHCTRIWSLDGLYRARYNAVRPTIECRPRSRSHEPLNAIGTHSNRNKGLIDFRLAAWIMELCVKPIRRPINSRSKQHTYGVQVHPTPLHGSALHCPQCSSCHQSGPPRGVKLPACNDNIRYLPSSSNS